VATQASPSGTLMMRGTLAMYRARRQAVEELVDDLAGFADLLETDPEPGEAVAVGVGDHVPVDLSYQPDGLIAAQVPVDAAGAQVGAGQAVLEGDLGRG
jgi:hypothetical protein